MSKIIAQMSNKLLLKSKKIVQIRTKNSSNEPKNSSMSEKIVDTTLEHLIFNT